MKLNIFEGARRIALMIAGIAVAGTLFALATYDPYVSIQYSIAHPNGAFVRMQESCPSDAERHYFSSRTSSGESVSVDLCLLAMSFGKDNARLIPYKIDEQGMIWGAASYSSEVSDYERKLEGRFKLPASDEGTLKKEISQRYRENWVSGLGYLVAGLVIFAGVVWAIGWIVRGFLGIPHGMDRRPE
ncbi:MAG: hypothetical protein ACYC2E_13080 [Sulfuricella sp.]